MLQDLSLRLKKLAHRARSKAARLYKSRYASNPRIWIPAVVLILAAVFWALPAYGAKAPGQLGYAVKRFEESAATTLAPSAGLRDGLRLDFAQRRVDEATYVAIHANDSDSGKAQAAPLIGAIKPDNTKAANTINQLLSQFTAAYQAHTTKLAKDVDQDKKFNTGTTEQLRKQAVQIYTALALLRVQAPVAAQISVLTGIDTAQKNIAVVNDALDVAPLSASDVSQLTKLVSVGILSKADLDKLLSTQMNNRQFHTKLVELVDTKQVPSNLIYSLDEDLVKRLAPDKVTGFEAVSDFEQMQRISATVQSVRPTKAQQQAIQDYLGKYKPGDVIPDSDIRPFVTPVVYGMALAGELQTNISGLSTTSLSSDDQAVLDSWKGSLAANQQNLGQLYRQLMTEAAHQPDLHQRLLARVQIEFIDAQKEGVDHLVLPPGWGDDQLADLSKQVSIELAANHFVAANPGSAQQLAVLTNTQKQLQTSLVTVDKTRDTIISNLETQVNGFTGTPEQITQLKELLSLVKESQSTTVTGLQAQLAGVADLHTQLATTIETLRGEQLASLVELELRAASNATDLTAAARAELTTTLNEINQTTRGLVDGLQSRVDSLGSTNTALQEQLDSSLQTIQDNHIELTAYVTAQVAAGRQTTDQLQTTLQSVQTSLTQQAAQLSGLNAGTDALTQLVNQVQATTTNQVNTLQGQVDDLKIDQQAVTDAVDTLRTTQTAELDQLSDQLAELSVLQTEAQVVVMTIGQQQTQMQTSLGSLTNNFTVLQTALETVQNSQTAILSDVANQQSQLSSLQTQTQSAINELTEGQAQLSTQIASLTNNAANLSTIVSAIQAASTTTQTQLDTLLANPPWSIVPEGTYATQAAFDALEASLDAQFAAKAAALDSQFQIFQQQVDAELQQVNTTVTELSQTVTTQNTTQQQAIDALNAQVQALQTQVQALTAPPGGL